MTQSLKAFYKTILFHSGSEFMVCKMEIERNVRHIYLREVLLGQGNNVVLWLDENMHKRSLLIHHRWIQLATKQSDHVKFIFKT